MRLSAADLCALAPLAVLGLAALLTTGVTAFWRRHGLVAGLAVLGLLAAEALAPGAAAVAPRRIGVLLVIDAFALFYIRLLVSAGVIVAALAYDYLSVREGEREEFYILLLLAVLGGSILVASAHLASLFLGLELLSISLYVLIAYLRTSPHGLEAGVKYLILAGASSAFLLFGMALLYAATGTLELGRLAEGLVTAEGRLLLLGGMALLLTGLGFKLAVVPFHMWTPDVYQGAPAPVTALLATVSKGAVLALLLRLFAPTTLHAGSPLWWLLATVATASMIVGNLLALLQENVKRILAYSSIAHLGYMLVALLAGGSRAVEAVTFYLAAYFVTILGAFGVVGVLSGLAAEAERLDEYRGLLWRHPWLATFFAAILFSLAGIPLTAGFMAKFYVFAAGAASALWGLVLVVALTSALGLFYYLRVIVVMFGSPAESRTEEPGAARVTISLAGRLALGLLALLLLWLGTYPSPLVQLIQRVAAGLA
ncbi:MAG TPA: NADH-quinone oxidoreductase subunit N [Candidatus Sulfotelmatobacter sp.]|nr:NADH-quinone oxidoreductase subunit N [Candidatus Sulfotelmatobacter sp.]